MLFSPVWMVWACPPAKRGLISVKYSSPFFCQETLNIVDAGQFQAFGDGLDVGFDPHRIGLFGQRGLDRQAALSFESQTHRAIHESRAVGRAQTIGGEFLAVDESLQQVVFRAASVEGQFLVALDFVHIQGGAAVPTWFEDEREGKIELVAGFKCGARIGRGYTDLAEMVEGFHLVGTYRDGLGRRDHQVHALGGKALTGLAELDEAVVDNGQIHIHALGAAQIQHHVDITVILGPDGLVETVGEKTAGDHVVHVQHHGTVFVTFLVRKTFEHGYAGRGSGSLDTQCEAARHAFLLTGHARRIGMIQGFDYAAKYTASQHKTARRKKRDAMVTPRRSNRPVKLWHF